MREKPRRGRRPLYPWDKWTDGQWWTCEQGEDFSCKSDSFRTGLYRYGMAHGYSVEVQVDGDVVHFQFTRGTRLKGGGHTYVTPSQHEGGLQIPDPYVLIGPPGAPKSQLQAAARAEDLGERDPYGRLDFDEAGNIVTIRPPHTVAVGDEEEWAERYLAGDEEALRQAAEG